MSEDDISFNPAGVGVWQEPSTFEVTAERIAEYAAATNDPIAAHRSGELAPPAFAIVPVFGAMGSAAFSIAPVDLLPRLLHGEQDFHFHRPIRPGDVLTTRCKATGYEGKPTGTRGTIQIECHDRHGQLVNEQYVTFFFRGYDAGPKVGELGPEHSFDSSAEATAPVATVVQHVDHDQTYRYGPAAGDPVPIHLDEDFATAAGLPGIIAHGMCTLAFTSWAAVTELAGGDSRRLRRLAVRFSKPVLPGQDIETSFWRTARGGGTTTYAYETAVGPDLVIRDGLATIAD
ncbi:MAG: MaoC family dehydratase N-terminal domain-containing protein [Frankiaceae bacterium]|nr:MaoC family dehydratase N-terminal domain-containing protein [Frankiaceae bacterium]